MNQQTINRHLDRLAKNDPELRRGLAQVGYPPPRIRPPGFETLLSTIVSQQISTAAAAAIMQRLHALLPNMAPAALLDLPRGALRAAGLSSPKVAYAEDLARAVIDGRVAIDRFDDMEDAAVVEAITSLKGFGTWSAEIYLMFSLRREDVFPAGDLALRSALQRLRGLNEKLSEKRARELIADWSPYRSAGSLFLWHFYHGTPL
ncbi:MAG TPA: DNA-3-methyladenine glycosylase 2 family protein [Gammaproteobacteria bacterium]|jgi:DNA-3-methyladenine glycosylase II